MLQFSVYSRVCRADEGLEKHLRAYEEQLPTRGSVRTLQVTDRQYARMRLILGEAGKREKAAGQQLVLL